jgi:hypothetical protein
MDWMDCIRAYSPEVLRLKVRAKDVALLAAADFLSNFLVAAIIPQALEKLGTRRTLYLRV